MLKRQPNRPTQKGFEGAASRLITGEYAGSYVYSQMGAIGIGYTSGRAADADIVRREWLAEGRRGEPETLTEFATRQLAAYTKLRNS